MKLYVLVPPAGDGFASAAREAGATPVASPSEIAEPLAHGRTGSETLARVKELVAQGQSPIAMGGLDRETLARCRDAGAAGFALGPQLWLLPGTPLAPADCEALARLTRASFDNGDATLPSGLTVGRDALLATYYVRRSQTLEQALADVRADAQRAVMPQLPPRAALPATQETMRQGDHEKKVVSSPGLPGSLSPESRRAMATPEDWHFETTPHDEAVAIIGVGCVLPRADNPQKF